MENIELLRIIKKKDLGWGVLYLVETEKGYQIILRDTQGAIRFRHNFKRLDAAKIAFNACAKSFTPFLLKIFLPH